MLNPLNSFKIDINSSEAAILDNLILKKVNTDMPNRNLIYSISNQLKISLEQDRSIIALDTQRLNYCINTLNEYNSNAITKIDFIVKLKEKLEKFNLK